MPESYEERNDGMMQTKRTLTLTLIATLFSAGSLVLAVSAIAVRDGHMHEHGPHGPRHMKETAFGRPGDPVHPFREIEISMKENDGTMLFEPSLIDVKKGEQIRFKIRNVGELEHEIVIATLAENLAHAKKMAENPEMRHQSPNARRLEPQATGELIWKFTKAGEFDMSCLIPGHRESGMTGKIIVK